MEKAFLLNYSYYHYNRGNNRVGGKNFMLVYAKSYEEACEKLLQNYNNGYPHRIDEGSIENHTIE